jgi:hypothetical protein
MAGAHGIGDEIGRHVDETELGATEQLERAVAGYVSPDQAEVPIGPVAADRRAGEVVTIVGAAADRHSDLPANLFGVTAERFDS